MSNEIDLEQFIQVLDHALATDDPKIKKALKKFLFIAALAMEGDPEPGPFTQMFEEMDDLRRRVRDLENAGAKKLYDTTLTDYYYGGSSATPQWIYSGGTSTAGSNSGTVTITPSSTSGSTSTTINTGGCTGYIPSTSTTYGGFSTFTIDLGDDTKGKRIKRELEEKLGSLTKGA